MKKEQKNAVSGTAKKINLKSKTRPLALRRSVFEQLESRDNIGSLLPFFPGGGLAPSVAKSLNASLNRSIARMNGVARDQFETAPTSAFIDLSRANLESNDWRPEFDAPQNGRSVSGGIAPDNNKYAWRDDVASSSASELNVDLAVELGSEAPEVPNAGRFNSDATYAGVWRSPSALENTLATSSAMSVGSGVSGLYSIGALGERDGFSVSPRPSTDPYGDLGGGADASNAVEDATESAEPAVAESNVAPTSGDAGESESLGGDESGAIGANAGTGVVSSGVTQVVRFANNLANWSVTENGGTESGAGGATAIENGALMREGDSFVVEMRQSWTVTSATRALAFTYETGFDSSDTTSINDAFEVAFVDSDGYSLVKTFSKSRDSFFNITEGLDSSVGGTTTLDAESGLTRVTLDLSNVPEGAEGTLIFRLVNNDGDSGSWVRIYSATPTGGGSTPTITSFEFDVPEGGVVEGSPVALAVEFADAYVGDVHSAVVDWGDGTIETVEVAPTGAGGAISTGHVYADNGEYTATVTVTDAQGVSTSASGAVTVANVAPSMSELAVAVDGKVAKDGTVERYVVVSGEFSDPGFTYPLAGTAETFVVSVDWGDGTVEESVPTVVQGGVGVLTQGAFTLRHSYAEGGIYTVRVTVTDDDGGADAKETRFGYGEIYIGLPMNRPITGDYNILHPVYPVQRHAEIPVVVRSVGNLDATALDVATVRFYPGEAADSNGGLNAFDVEPYADGVRDAIFHFSSYDAVVRPVDKLGYLTGAFADGTPFFGVDTIKGTPISSVISDQADPRVAADSNTKFFVVDASANSVFRYTSEGEENGDFFLTTSPGVRDITANVDGSKLWIVDSIARTVETRSPDGWKLGAWRALDMQDPQGIATNGADIWLVDGMTREILKYSDAAAHTQGAFTADASFKLDPNNEYPTSLATDGATLWVTDDRLNSVFLYDAATGATLGSWTLDPENADPIGITNDPTGASDSIWILDYADKLVYEYERAANLTTGEATLVGTFALAEGNQRPMGIVDPAVLTVATPAQDDVYQVDSTIVLNGVATTDGDGETIVATYVNGKPVDAIDLSGNFFVKTQVEPGNNLYEITAFDSNGGVATETVAVYGRTESEKLEDMQFDVSPSFKPSYARTSFDERADILYAELAIENVGQYAADAPFYVGVRNISDLNVTPLDPVGVTKEGIPYYDVSSAIEGGALNPNEKTLWTDIAFLNPGHNRFTYELVYVYKTNQPPTFVTVPGVEAYPDKDYSYPARATDPNNDVLTYSLDVAPDGMTINPKTGDLAWTPSELGAYSVTIRVEDGRGGSATQTYTINVTEQPENRAPVIVTDPVTEVTITNESVNAVSGLQQTNLENWDVVVLEECGRGFHMEQDWWDIWFGGGTLVVDHEDPDWQVDGDQVTQKNNADGSMLISNFDMYSERIEGTWMVSQDPDEDDDWIGFVFGYQDEQHFYLFDWKMGECDWFDGHSDAGMRIAVVNSDDVLGPYDMTNTAGSEGKVTTLYHNDIPWEKDKEYRFILDYFPGLFHITIKDGDTVLMDEEFEDSTYLKGKFGFYNYSQGEVLYKGFKTQEIENADYFYDVDAIDPDGDDIVYTLSEAPEGMKINPVNGAIRWSPTVAQIGEHTVTVVATDIHGAFDTQTFTVVVRPNPGNHDPIIISEPVTTVIVDVEEQGYQNDLVFTLPGVPGQIVETNFDWLERDAAYDNEFGIYKVDSADGAVNGILPNDPRYAAAAFAEGNYDVVFQSGEGAGAKKKMNLVAGQLYSFYLVVDNTTENFLAINPTNDGDSDPYVWFGYQAANPDGGYDHLHTEVDENGVTTFYWEDLWQLSGGHWGDGRSFYDLVFTIDSALLYGDHELYQYNVVAVDPDEDDITYALLNGPENATINPQTGELTWITELGQYNFTVLASDGHGGTDIQSFVVNVVEPGTGTISGYIVNDVNANGEQDTGEGYLANHVVWLDQNQNGRLDPNEKSTTSDANGYYEFTNLPSDAYFVRYQESNGWIQTFPSECEWKPGSNLIVNGTFEDVPEFSSDYLEVIVDNSINVGDSSRSGGYVYLNANDETIIKGWTVPYGSVSVHAPSWNKMYEGDYCIDLQGVGYGALQQTIFTKPGEQYVVQYAVAGNAHGGSRVKPYAIEAANDRYEGSFDVSNLDPDNMQWEIRSFSFTAIDTETTIRFVGLGTDSNGPLVDAIVVSETIKDGYSHGYTIVLGENQRALNRNFGAVNSSDLQVGSLTIVSTPPTTASVGEVYRYDVITVNPSGTELDFTLLSAPSGMGIHHELGTIVWRPTNADVGEYQAVVKVRNAKGEVATQAFTITVEAANHAPVITTESLPSPVLAASPYRAYIYAQDADNDALTYSLANAPNGMTIDPTTGVLDWTPDAALIGTVATVSVVVTDARGKNAAKSYALNVVATLENDAPIITSAPRTRTRMELPYVYLVQAHDPNGDRLTFAASGTLADGSAITGIACDPETGLVQWTPTAAEQGTASVTVTVSDGRGGVASQTYALDVITLAENSAPKIISTPARTGIVGKTWRYQAEAIDPDGDLVYWSLKDAPDGASINPATGEIVWVPTYKQLAGNLVTVVCTDLYGASTEQTFTVTIRGVNRPPVILSAPNAKAATEMKYVYALRANDPDGDTLTYSLTEGAAPNGMTIDPQLGLITWTPTADDAGLQTVSVRVDDGNGGVDTQIYTINVIDSALNEPPVIVSSPKTATSVGAQYDYRVIAKDPEGDAITYSYEEGPDDATFDATTGQFSWSPSESDIGEARVVFAAIDSYGKRGVQSYTLTVGRNQAPTITSTPGEYATPMALYSYDVQATDPEGDAIRYSLERAPEGMTIDEYGRLRWTPGLDFMGAFASVVVVATDSYGNVARQEFNLGVRSDDEAPTVKLVFATNVYNMGDTARISVQALDNVGVDKVTLLVGGVEQALRWDASSQLYTANVLFETSGGYEVYATAIDYAGNVGKSETYTFYAADPNDSTAPTITFHALYPQVYNDAQGKLVDDTPITGDDLYRGASMLSYLTDLDLSIEDDNMANWTIELASTSAVNLNKLSEKSDAYRTLETGYGELNHHRVRIDPTILANDAYVLRVTAYDANGQGRIDAFTFGVEGGAKLGQFAFTTTDMYVSRNGVSLAIQRTYDTASSSQSADFGYGWTLAIADPKISETTQPQNEMVEGDRVYITTPDGDRVGFTYKPSVSTWGGFIFSFTDTTAYFEPDPGVEWTLSCLETPPSSGGIFFPDISGEYFNPANYVLTSKDGTSYYYKQKNGEHETLWTWVMDQFYANLAGMGVSRPEKEDDSGLYKIVDPNGVELTVTKDGITHSAGGFLTIDRDARGRITSVTDHTGATVAYTYNASGDLVAFSNQIDSPTGAASISYSYLKNPAHFLDKAYDKNGDVVFQAEFDEAGRLVGMTDALGNVVQQEFDPGAMNGTIRDANGNVTNVWYDERGNVTLEEKPVVNVLTGETTVYTKTYDYGDARFPDKETRVVDYNGTVTEYVYDDAGNQAKISIVSPDGSTSVYSDKTYDSKGNVTSETLPGSQTLAYAYDDAGNTTAMSIGASVVNSTYNSDGKETSATDANGNVTRMEYPEVCPCNAPRKIIWGDGTYEMRYWNRHGAITRVEYYNADGTLAKYVETTYDDLDRKETEITGKKTENGDDRYAVAYEYDGDSDRVTVELVYNIDDPNNSDYTYSYYDKGGNLIRKVEPGMNRTDPNAGIFYKYDGNGNLVWQRDAIGNVTTWIYDAMNRVVEERDSLYWAEKNVDWSAMTDKEILALISTPTAPATNGVYDPSHIIRYAYDAADNMTEKVDQNGRRVSYSYDYLGNKTNETWYDEADDKTPIYVITYGYNANGQMTSAVSPDAEYTLTYNDVGYLKTLSVDYPWSANFETFTLTYEYDAMGNTTSVTDSTGLTVHSEYNGRNMLSSRWWSGAGVDEARADFTYNVLGNLTSVTRWADTERTVKVGTSEYTYDLVGRATDIIHKDALDQVLADYDYDYDFAGRLVAESLVSAVDGASRNAFYDYDELGQIISAMYDNGQANETFAWDANGNSALPGAKIGAGNRLLSDGTFNYEYDNVGNMIAKSRIHAVAGEANYTEYEYDYNNRLVAVNEYSSKGGIMLHSETYRHDMFGRRVQTVSDGVETISTFNGIGEFANEWARFDADGKITERFLFGANVDQLVAQWSLEQGLLWALTDRLGSIRDLMNNAGKIVQHMNYTAFGAPIFITPAGGLSNHAATHPYAFTGRVWDSLANMNYFRARTFDPATGRFTSADPLRFEAGDMNLYRYLNNSPFKGTDPSGKCFVVDAMILGFLVGALVGALLKETQCSVGLRDTKGAIIWMGTFAIIGMFAMPFLLAYWSLTLYYLEVLFPLILAALTPYDGSPSPIEATTSLGGGLVFEYLCDNLR